LCSHGGDAGGGRLVVEAVSHGCHVFDVFQAGGHNGVGHGCRETLEEETLEEDASFSGRRARMSCNSWEGRRSPRPGWSSKA
jgi:hypothetical protein